MATKCKYTVDFLRKIGNCAKSKVNYPLFGLETTTRAWIISLGIRSRPNKYQRTRSRRNLCHKMHTIVNQDHPGAHRELHFGGTCQHSAYSKG